MDGNPTTTVSAELGVGPARTCVGCGYDLRGLPESRCPECGTAFDPLEPPRPNVDWMKPAGLGTPGAFVRAVRLFMFHPRPTMEELLRFEPDRDAAIVYAKWICRLATCATVCAGLVPYLILLALKEFPVLSVVPATLCVAVAFASIGTFLYGSVDRFMVFAPSNAVAVLHGYAQTPLLFLPLAGALLVISIVFTHVWALLAAFVGFLAVLFWVLMLMHTANSLAISGFEGSISRVIVLWVNTLDVWFVFGIVATFVLFFGSIVIGAMAMGLRLV